MMRQVTNQNEILPYGVSDVEDVSRERVTGLIRVLKLRNLFVATPDRYFPGMRVGGIILARYSKVNEIVLGRSLSARKVFGNTGTVTAQVLLDGMKRLWVEISRIKHDVSAHAVPVL